MNLADHGVRKYDSDLGRFLCPDAMWEKYISYTPYQYAGNDPVNKVDWNGLYFIYPKNKVEKQQFKAMEKELEKSKTGRKFLNVARKSDVPITLKFGDVKDSKDFNATGKTEANGFEKTNKLHDVTITIEQDSKDIIPIFGHELHHFTQYLQDFVKWKTIGEKDKNKPHDEQRIEAEPIQTQISIKSELIIEEKTEEKK